MLITDTTASFYTRVGLIATSDTAQVKKHETVMLNKLLSQVIYNLNMTKADEVKDKVQIQKGLKQIDVFSVSFRCSSFF